MSYYNGPEIVTNNLVMCVDAANSKSYPGTGTTWRDISWSNMNVTVSATYTYNTKEGGSFFNGTAGNSDGMIFSLTNFPKTTGTIEMWAYPTSWSDGNGLIINRSTTTSNAVDWLWLGVWSSGSVLYFRLGDGSGCCNLDNTVSSWSTVHPVSTWGHYAVTWSSGESSTIYFNGRQRAYRAITSIPSTNPSVTGQIGIGHEATNSRWLGYIASTKIYNRQLTGSEVLQNFNALRSKYSL